jgi:AcrR family transcriptional regulator
VAPGSQKMEASNKRRDIVEKALELFGKHGARRVTIEELCLKAGVSKMTFYKYFKNKKDLIRGIKKDLMEEGFARFDEISALDIPYADKIQLMTRWKVEFAARIGAEFIREMVSIDDFLEESKRRFLANIAAGQARGELRPDISPEVLWLVVEKLQELTRDGDWKKACDDYGRYQEQVRNLVFFGLLSRESD